MRYLFLPLLLLSAGVHAQSTIEIDLPNGQAETLIEFVKSLQGEGVILENIKTNQPDDSQQMGRFHDEDFSLSMHTGLVLSTGSVNNLSGKNTAENTTGATAIAAEPTDKDNQELVIEYADASVDGLMWSQDSIVMLKMNNETYLTVGSNTIKSDDDLAAELGNQFKLFDACVVEMDLIPLGDSLNFRFLFGSEEYDEYVGTPFNDAFAFYISGPGIDGKKNMARLESGARISINSINDGNPAMPEVESHNPSFYNRNEGQIPLEYDGFTRTLEIKEKVEPFQTYHLKMVIADASDGIYDSGVFIESASIITYDHRFVINFDSDEFVLEKKQKNILTAMMTIAEDHPEYMLEISGHSDGDGSERYNLALSQSRIDKVVEFLASAGFTEDEMILVNKGESMPIADNETDEGKAQNRRVEIKLIPSVNTYLIPEEVLPEVRHFEITKVYPNPTRGNTNFEIQAQGEFQTAWLEVYNLSGELKDRIAVDGTTTSFDATGWASGIYSGRLIVDGQLYGALNFVVAQ